MHTRSLTETLMSFGWRTKSEVGVANLARKPSRLGDDKEYVT